MSILAVGILSFAIGVIVGLARECRPAWKQFTLGTRFRGPNSDYHYRLVSMRDGPHLFTAEEAARALERGGKYISDSDV